VMHVVRVEMSVQYFPGLGIPWGELRFFKSQRRNRRYMYLTCLVYICMSHIAVSGAHLWKTGTSSDVSGNSGEQAMILASQMG
jgi:hypothetical protein